MNGSIFQDIVESALEGKARVVVVQAPDHAAYKINVIAENFQFSQMIAYDFASCMSEKAAVAIGEVLRERLFSYATTGGEKMGDLMELVKKCDVVNDPIETRVKSAMIQADELDALGFKAQAEKIRTKARLKNRLNKLTSEKYIRITDDKIKAFVERLADNYNKDHSHRWKGQYVAPTVAASAQDYWTSNLVVSSGAMQYRDFANAAQQMYNSQLMSGIGMAVAGVPTDRKILCKIQAPTIHYNGSGPIGAFAWIEVPVSDYEGIPPPEVLKKFAAEKEKNLFDEYSVATVKGIHDPLLLGRIKGMSDRFFLAQWGDDVSLDDVI